MPRAPMFAGATEWWNLIDGLRPGDHVLFWQDASRTSETVQEAFLRGAIARHDLILAFLADRSSDRFRERLRGYGLTGDRLLEEGHLVALTPDELSSRDADVRKSIGGVHDETAATGRRSGHTGLSILAELGSPRFAQGEQEAAVAIESMLHERRRFARTLCLYRAQDLYPLRAADGYALIRLHTHTITAFGEGRLIAEAVAVPSEPAMARAAKRPRASWTDL